MKVRHRGMTIKPVETPRGIRYRVPYLGSMLFDSEVAARRAIGRKRGKGKS